MMAAKKAMMATAARGRRVLATRTARPQHPPTSAASSLSPSIPSSRSPPSSSSSSSSTSSAGSFGVGRRGVATSPAARRKDAERETHFGFKNVPEGEKKGMVGEVFTGVASNYDVMNDVMSIGVHRLWKDYFVSCVQPTSKTAMLDVAGGTGDIAFRALDYVRRNEQGSDTSMEVTVCDINPAMLEEGAKKVLENGYLSEEGNPQVKFVEGDAEALPFEDESFDVYTIAFGLRNVTDIEKALLEAKRVLKPGGRFCCLEFSRVENPLLGPMYDMYSFNVIPAMGELVAQNREAYQYLVESIRKHPPQQELRRMMIKAGFTSCDFENLSLGIVAIHSGFKP
mmetsp:Transcript_23618/g.57221  ORF Transcript_23618/g.57221 Transcript_23618/m.57221 type:complete len:340 (-) Transcript_23618:226-1245(-)